MTQVRLIIPPSGFQLDERVFPMLGVLKVATVLERQEGVRVRVLDLSAPAEAGTVIANDWASYGPSDVYGFSVTTPQMPAAMRLLSMVRQWAPNARAVLGGPHVTLMNTAAKAEFKAGRPGRGVDGMKALSEHFDVLVSGDGEHAILQALRPDAPAMIDADDPASPLFLSKDDLAAVWPARHLINLGSYHYDISGHKSTSLIGQLGCPFSCGFCGGRNSPSFRRVRTRPPQDIVAEMVFLWKTYGYTGFMFLDDELNVSPAFMTLLTAIKQAQDTHGVEWRLRGLVKSELLTLPMAEAMYAAGFRQVLSGFESGDDRILKNMSKRSTVEQNTRTVEIIKTAGMGVKALMSLGHPGETVESVAATLDWLLTVKPEAFDITVITVYPGTPYHDDAVETSPGVWTYTAKSGDRLHARMVDQFTDEPFYKGVPGQYQSFVHTDALSAEKLVRLRDAVERIARRSLDIPWPQTAAEAQFEKSMASSFGR